MTGAELLLSVLPSRKEMQKGMFEGVFANLMQRNDILISMHIHKPPAQASLTKEYFCCFAPKCDKVFTSEDRVSQLFFGTSIMKRAVVGVTLFACDNNCCVDALKEAMEKFSERTLQFGNLLCLATDCDEVVQPVFVSVPYRRCQMCDKSGQLLHCKGCLFTCYCSVACQRRDWRAHKRQCAMLTKLLDTKEKHVCEID